MHILFIGDIVGRLGREVVKKVLFSICEKYDIDFVIANGENASHGKGLTSRNFDELLDAGIDAVTLGNHYDNKAEIRRYIDTVDELIRPLNLVHDYPGEGSKVFDLDGIKIRVTNVLGSAFMKEEVTQPYYSVSSLLKEIEGEDSIHIIDFHGESTSEKQAFAYAFDGKVTAVLGTHTHVQTRDYHVLEKGTAYCSDVGMCGAYESVIGFEKESVINKVIFSQEGRFQLEEKGKALFSGMVLDVDEVSLKCNSIDSIYIQEEIL